MFSMFRSSKAMATFPLSKRNSVCRSGRAMKFIGSRVNRTSLVSPVIELHKMLRAAAPVTFCRDQLGESDKKYDERPVTGERLTQRIIVQRYPKRKNSRDRNKLYAKNILRRSIVPSWFSSRLQRTANYRPDKWIRFVDRSKRIMAEIYGCNINSCNAMSLKRSQPPTWFSRSWFQRCRSSRFFESR